MLTPIGTKCKIITEPFKYSIHGIDSDHSGHEFPIGTIVIIKGHDGDDPLANIHADYEDGHDYWYINENDIEVIE